jgi:hypothetical protein
VIDTRWESFSTTLSNGGPDCVSKQSDGNSLANQDIAMAELIYGSLRST